LKNRKRAIVALAAGTLLLGTTTGQTFATWQTSRNLQGSPVVTGEFTLVHHGDNLVNGVQVWDWSISRVGQQVPNVVRAQKLGTRIQAGDVVTAKTYVNTALDGTNLVARLVPTNTTTGAASNALAGLEVSYGAGTNKVVDNAIAAASWVTSVKVGDAQNTLTGLTPGGTTVGKTLVTVTITVPPACGIQPTATCLPGIALSDAGTSKIGTDLVQDVNFGGFTLVLEQVRS